MTGSIFVIFDSERSFWHKVNASVFLFTVSGRLITDDEIDLGQVYVAKHQMRLHVFQLKTSFSPVNLGKPFLRNFVFDLGMCFSLKPFSSFWNYQ